MSQDGIYIPADANGNPADVVIHGNNLRGTLTWNPAYPQTLPASYYLTSKPAFYGALAWPSIGGDMPFGQGTIPALARWESGDYIPSPAAPGPVLKLSGAPADHAVHLSWSVEGSLPATSTWQIDYYTIGSLYPAITGIPGSTRAYTLTSLTNYTWYTVTLTAIGTDPLLSATVRVMPTGISVYLPLIMRAY
ncbi:MAG: hypothetical protein JW850_07655 [Thermoflexales bacterium]|nr:hypothetical protein [Thermoflexales bacterium]